MRANIAWLTQKFYTFNDLIFAGRLPEVPVLLSHARTFLGACSCRRRRRADGSVETGDFKLRFSTRFDLSETEWEDTLIHEMIHYYIGVNQWQDSSAHGPLFRRLMEDINARFGRHILIRHREAKCVEEEAAEKPVRGHVVAKVVFRHRADGPATGIKVLPRITARIVNYYNVARRNDTIESVTLFLSDNPFFERYPHSGALRVHCLDAALIDLQLQGAERLACDGKRLFRSH